MFLKKFRFEDLIALDEEGLDWNFRRRLQNIIRNQLQRIRMVENLEETE